MSESKNIKEVKSTAFDWVFRGLIAIVLYLVMEMRTDMKTVLQVIPAIRVEIDNLKDKRLLDRLRQLEVTGPAKHEDVITLDTLKK